MRPRPADRKSLEDQPPGPPLFDRTQAACPVRRTPRSHRNAFHPERSMNSQTIHPQQTLPPQPLADLPNPPAPLPELKIPAEPVTVKPTEIKTTPNPPARAV